VTLSVLAFLFSVILSPPLFFTFLIKLTYMGYDVKEIRNNIYIVDIIIFFKKCFYERS